ncbi:MAG: DivIVA domain-containing protein [Ruminococcus sp.]|nr:DivIVA domain-containing protein [Ruminococcus sp.]
MLTIDEIKEISFRTVGKKGYYGEEVDAFIDEVIATVEQLTAEKNECLRKMDILAGKVEQYREKEETINNALYTAEQLKEEKLKEAKAKADYIVKTAEQKRRTILTEAEMATEREKDKFQAMQEDTAKLREELLAVYKKHILLIKELPDMDAALKTREQLDEKYPFEPVDDADVKIAPDRAEVEEAAEEAVEEPVEEAAETEQPKLKRERNDKFEKLQFGDNYDV